MKTKFFTIFLAIFSSSQLLFSHHIQEYFYKTYHQEMLFLLVQCDDGLQRGYVIPIEEYDKPLNLTNKAVDRVVKTFIPVSYEMAVEAFGIEKINHLYYTQSVMEPLPWSEPDF